MTSDDPTIGEFTPTKVPEERPGPAGGKRHLNRLARTRALCEAGVACFLEQGLDSATIDDIVREANVSKGSFYRYFDHKEALVGAVFAPVREIVVGAMEQAAGELEDATDDEALAQAYSRMATMMMSVLLEQPGTLRLFLQERHGPSTPSRAPILELDDAIVGQAVRMTHAARKGGMLKPVDPRVSALAVIGAVHELLWQRLRGADTPDPMTAATQLIDLVLHGVRAPEPTR